MAENRLVVHMIGNAHIDPVWLWRWQEGVDEALASFRSAADRCDEYPEFLYTRGEAWLYDQVERIDPQLFARVEKLIAAKRWFPTGGQWVQPDANGPTEMGWHRQLQRGKKYFQERFGVASRVGYNLDTFGHPATLPDILQQNGYDAYVFHRPSPHQVPLPSQAFRWQGEKGGEVTGFRLVPAYTTRSDDLYGQIMLTLEACDPSLGHAMCFYGVGNHGGGPTKGNIEYILENKLEFEGAELRFSTPQMFFDAISDKRDSLPVVTHELQRTFPGCYSVMHDIKSEQRQGEWLLDQAARVLAFEENDSDSARIDAAWDDLLFTQFHDILAGTSSPLSWQSVRAMQGRARMTGEEIICQVARRHVRNTLPPVNQQQIALVNAGDSNWQDFATATPFLDFDDWRDRWISDLDGNPVPFQRVQPVAMMSQQIVLPVDVPARGVQLLLLQDGPGPQTAPIETDLSADESHIANKHLRVEVGAKGIARVLAGGKNILGDDGIGLHLRADKTDTWSFHVFEYSEEIKDVLGDLQWVVEESGPLRARLRSESWLGHSAVRWTITLFRDDPRLLLDLEVNWSEKFTMLQMPIHLAQEPTAWRDGLPGGGVNRTPNEAATEWPVQSWSRLQTPNAALALLTEDAYSLSVHENLWQWSLLRSPKMAWGGGDPEPYAGRDWFTDQGPHNFSFALHVSSDANALDDETLWTKARQMAQKPIVFDRYEGMDRPPWKNNPPRGMWTGAEQRARQDGRMMHLDMSGPANIEEDPLTAETGTTETEPPDVE